MPTALLWLSVWLLAAAAFVFGWALGRRVAPHTPELDPTILRALEQRMTALLEAQEADRDTNQSRYDRLRAAIMRRGIPEPSHDGDRASEDVLALRKRLNR